MIGSAHDTSPLPVRLRRELGFVSDDGMYVGMAEPSGPTGEGGPYRASAAHPKPRTFHVVDVQETTVAVIEAPESAMVRGQITQALLQRHAVVVFVERDESGAELTVSSRALQLPAAIMLAARATAAVKVVGGWDEARSFDFVVRESGSRADAVPHHVRALATFEPPEWRVAAFRRD